MPISIHDTVEPMYLAPLPCGGVPTWDFGSGCAYRCSICDAVIGSIGMPQHCKEMMEQNISAVGQDLIREIE